MVFYEKTKIRGYVLTDVSRDGMLSGLDTKIIKENLKLSEKKLEIVSTEGIAELYDGYELKEDVEFDLSNIIFAISPVPEPTSIIFSFF